jgi:very-short-patch-repair endonuclease
VSARRWFGFVGERGKPILVRQRMDFLLLLRSSVRVVIEIDGKQHYSDVDGKASPQLYAKMVAEDRRIRCLGYEIYRSRLRAARRVESAPPQMIASPEIEKPHGRIISGWVFSLPLIQ